MPDIPILYTNALCLRISPTDEVWLDLQCKAGGIGAVETLAQAVMQPRLAVLLRAALDTALTEWAAERQRDVRQTTGSTLWAPHIDAWLAKGMTQGEIAKLAGTTRQSVSAWLKLHRNGQGRETTPKGLV